MVPSHVSGTGFWVLFYTFYAALLILSGFVHLTFRMAPFFSQCCFRAQVTCHSLWQGDFPRNRKQVVKQAQVPPGSVHTIVSPLEWINSLKGWGLRWFTVKKNYLLYRDSACLWHIFSVWAYWQLWGLRHLLCASFLVSSSFGSFVSSVVLLSLFFPDLRPSGCSFFSLCSFLFFEGLLFLWGEREREEGRSVGRGQWGKRMEGV